MFWNLRGEGCCKDDEDCAVMTEGCLFFEGYL